MPKYKVKLIRITTVPISLKLLLSGQLSFMQKHFEVIAISSGPLKDLKEINLNQKVKVLEVQMFRTITPFKDFCALWNMIKIFIKEKPNIVHTHTPKAGFIGMIAAKLTGIPIRLHTVSGLPLVETKGVLKIILIFIEKLTYSFATKVYPNSRGLYNYIVENIYSNKNKIKIISNGSSNGINTSFFNPNIFSSNEQKHLKKTLGISENDFVFIFVGRIVSQKGINELVHVFSQLNLDSVKLLLVGPYENELDPLFNSTVNLIDQNTNILSVGFQNDVRKYFAISNCLVFPSYREGFPNVVMQAGAMGLPSIVTNINGCNEIIEDGINGTLILPKSTEDLYKAMLRMVSDLQWRNNLAANARNMIISRYDQQLFWNALLEEYNHLVSSILKKG
jgi:glycosyltransferase involved in cell wall biosynthesis